ncbi:hypothetical protein I4641_10705 [Waterburya agarophytonicola K14]|uniref:Uncharacterized protein n=1 Tax=Waterburya agarophytonicola KI4 TaxID=2874699 RepID=A0A964FFY7_9CYAN|nr:hypothetical protein [Waterburya agarophytonicola]MCC0177446.1 hypothetical protein [Waterburya agarophytonicola KI4]
MIEYTKTRSITNWLKTKFTSGDNGMIFDEGDRSSFEEIQEFIASEDRQFKTPIIYYQAFPEETAIEFLSTLQDELDSKMGKSGESSPKSLLTTTIKDAGLKMIVIDDCYLHPQDTLENLLDFFSCCNVAVILVSCRRKIAIAQILNHPIASQWDKLQTARGCKTIL